MVSVEEICRCAADVIKLVSPVFTAIRRWAAAFIQCLDLSLRAKMPLSQRLPHDLEEKLISFWRDGKKMNLMTTSSSTWMRHLSTLTYNPARQSTNAGPNVCLFIRQEAGNITSQWCLRFQQVVTSFRSWCFQGETRTQHSNPTLLDSNHARQRVDG